MLTHRPQSQRPYELTSHVLPVTALAYLSEDVVLSGEGGLLCMHLVSNQKSLKIWRIFDDQAIHGIVVDPVSKHIAVYGGRYARVIAFDQAYSLVHLDDIVEVEDWILDAVFVDSQVTFITAHNALVSLDAAGKTGKGSERPRPTTRIAGVNTILYSAHIITTEPDKWLIAAGTAFGDVILWSCSRTDTDVYTSITHYSFSAHEGSTFGVQISPLLPSTTLGTTSRVLASCSDDRTVRIWDISSYSATIAVTEASARSTGFSATPSEDSGRPALLAKAMGHVSRIWHVRFDLSHSQVVVKSFGEDATTIDWLLEYIDGNHFSLRKLSTFGANPGKHIWSVGAVNGAKGIQRFVVGGGDGAVVQIPPSMISDLEGNDLLFRSSTKKDNVKSYQFLNQRTLLMTTTQGTVNVVDIAGEQPTIRASFERPDLANYSLVTSSATIAFIGGTDSVVYAYLDDTQTLLSIDSPLGKVSALFAHPAKKTEDAISIALLSTRATNADLYLQVLQFSDDSVEIVKQHSLSVPNNAGVTSTAFAPAEGSALIAAGLRSGQIVLYDLNDNMSHGLSITSSSTASIHTEAVTALQWVVDTSGSTNGTLISTSRDGTYAITQVDGVTGTVKLTLLHRLELSIGANIEGLLITPEQDVLVYGFRNKHFIVMSIKAQEELFTIECGGAHRNWSMLSDDGGLSFVWTKASKMHYQHKSQKEHCKLSYGGHGREIKAAAVTKLDAHRHLIATGGQDTDIKLWTTAGEDGPRCLHTLRQHNTGPQCIAFSEDGQYMFSSGGFEEFFVWRIHKDCPVLGVGIVCESIHPNTSSSDLRITSFSVTAESNGWDIIMTYSDSRVAAWRYCSDKSWHCIAEADYLTSCPTATTSFDAGNKHVITATDGHISTWQLRQGAPSSLTWTSRHQAHQSAILCSVNHEIDTVSSMLITGGDDNAITFTRMGKKSASSLAIRRAHAAAVTALELYSIDNMLLLFSAGLDQRLIVWQLNKADESTNQWLTARKLHAISTGVADVSGLSLLSVNKDRVKILITGVGMEVWTIALPTTTSIT